MRVIVVIISMLHHITYGSNMSEEVEIQSSENPAMDFSQESTQNTSNSSPVTSPLVHDWFHSYHTTESGNIIGKIDDYFKKNVHKQWFQRANRDQHYSKRHMSLAK